MPGVPAVPGVPGSKEAELKAIRHTLRTAALASEFNINIVDQGSFESFGPSKSVTKNLAYLKASTATRKLHQGQLKSPVAQWDLSSLIYSHQVGFDTLSDPGDQSTTWKEGCLWEEALGEPVRQRAKELTPQLSRLLCQMHPNQNLLAVMSVTGGRLNSPLMEALDWLPPQEEAVLMLLQFLHHTQRGTLLRGPFLARGLQMGGSILTFQGHKWCTRPGAPGILPLEDGPQELMDFIDLCLKAMPPTPDFSPGVPDVPVEAVPHGPAAECTA